MVAAYFPETDYVVATRGDGYAFVYFPTGWPAEINLNNLGAKAVKASWYDPRTGKSGIPEVMEAKGIRKFTPPSSGRGKDWILILDDASRNFKMPGE